MDCVIRTCHLRVMPDLAVSIQMSAIKHTLLMVAALVAWGLAAPTATASLVLPSGGTSTTTVADLVGGWEFDPRAEATSAGGESNAPDDEESDDSDHKLAPHSWDPATHVPAGSSSSSSASSAGSGGNAGLVVHGPSLVGDAGCVERLAGERKLFMPRPPTDDIFHPPRECRG